MGQPGYVYARLPSIQKLNFIFNVFPFCERHSHATWTVKYDDIATA